MFTSAIIVSLKLCHQCQAQWLTSKILFKKAVSLYLCNTDLIKETSFQDMFCLVTSISRQSVLILGIHYTLRMNLLLPTTWKIIFDNLILLLITKLLSY